MRRKLVILSTVLICMLEFSLVSVFAANGPKTPSMKIHIYDSSYQVNQDLDAGVLDINDQPLTPYWINRWAGNSQIALDSYPELGMAEIDMNNQMWPTGDPTNKFYKLSSLQANESLAFRQAVAFLTDRDAIITQVLGGYGFKMTVPLPPFQSQYMDPINYTTSVVTYNVGANSYQLNAGTDGITYPYNPEMAAYILDKAGFTMDVDTGVRIDPSTGKDLKPIIFVIRTDNSNFQLVGDLLTSALESAGVLVQRKYVPGAVVAQRVMQQYDYNLYTGSWTLSTEPTQYYDLYSSNTYYGPSVGGSQNYVGFCNNGSQFGATVSMANDIQGFDYWALKVQYPAYINPVLANGIASQGVATHDPDSAIGACQVAGYVFLKYCASLPLYCNIAYKAYQASDTGVINNAGCGIDNYYTFLNGAAADGTWDYGFSGDTYYLNPVVYGTTSQLGVPTPDVYLTTAKANGLMYESLMGVNQYTLAQTDYWIAQGYSIGSWDAINEGGDPDATYINFTIRPNIYWHDNMAQGRSLDVYDINFSFYFTQACGPGVAWNYPSVAAFDRCVVYPSTNTTSIYFLYKSAWAFLQAGGLPILNRDTWGILWNTANQNWQTDVRNYDPATAQEGGYGESDIYHDGTGAWIFNTYVRGDYKTFNDPYYYLNQSYIASRLAAMFHEAGDVNRDGVVNMQDLGLMARASGTTPASGGTAGDWGAWNPACDLNNDGVVNMIDLSVVTANYGKTMG